MSVSPEGYKVRRELEYQVVPLGTNPRELLETLGYRETQRIDRFVEYYDVESAAIRIEWYPRMDVLIEVEGNPVAIERALRVTGVPRERWRPDPLPVFAAEYQDRTGVPAVLSLAGLGGEPPAWPR